MTAARFLKAADDESARSLVNVLKRDLKVTLVLTTDVVVVITGVLVATTMVAAEGEIVPIVVRAAVVDRVSDVLVDVADSVVVEGSGEAVKTFLEESVNKTLFIKSFSERKAAYCMYLHITLIEEAARATLKVSLLVAAFIKV